MASTHSFIFKLYYFIGPEIMCLKREFGGET